MTLPKMRFVKNVADSIKLLSFQNPITPLQNFDVLCCGFVREKKGWKEGMCACGFFPN